jgi:putative hydrolase of the HAD superfamily
MNVYGWNVYLHLLTHIPRMSSANGDSQPKNKNESSMKTLLTDLGGVLLNVDFSPALKKLSSIAGLNEKEIERFSADLKDEYDAGNLTPLELYEIIFPEKQISFSEFESIWCNIFTEKKEVIDYIISLKKSWRLVLASNTDPLHYAFVKKNFPWFSSIDHTGLSFRLKAVKPSQDFFIRLCKKLNVQYQDVMFIDDLKENVEAAQNLGIRAHMFHNIEDLKSFISSAEKS